MAKVPKAILEKLEPVIIDIETESEYCSRYLGYWPCMYDYVVCAKLQ